MSRRLTVRLLPVAGALGLIATMLFWSTSATAATAVRINTGGTAQTVNGTNWSGCTSTSACNGYVSGGFPWSENPSSISGVQSPDSQTIEKSEWSGGSTNGVPWGGTAFSFAIPVSGSSTYAVKLHFTENNKTAAGQRVFDVKINGSTVLSNFDIFQAAGGEFKTVTRSFNAAAVNGKVTISFIRKVENAKISAIEVLGDGSTTTSTSTSTTTTTTVPGGTGSALRINTGGTAQTVNGTNWSGCTSTSACNGYVSGGFPWSENPSSISGVQSPDSQTIEKSEWSGGSTNGVPWGGTAFTFTIPASGSSNTVVLHFTENNKTAAGQRVFDVKINGSTVLSNFDIFQAAGGEFKTVTRSFNAAAVNGKVTISFIRKVENAKISAIEVLGDGSTTTTTTTSTTSTTAAPTTTTTTATSGNGKLSWTAIANSPGGAAEASTGVAGNKMYVFGGYYNNVWVPSNHAYAYDVTKNSWSTLPNVPKTLTHGASVSNGSNIIIAGGYSTNSSGAQIFAINNVWNFNTSTNTWSNLPNLPAARGSGGMALVGSTLHFFGGVDSNRVEQTTHWTLDLNNTAAGWQVSTPVPVGRTHFATIAVGTAIYLLDGLSGIDANSTEYSTVYKYETTTGQWTQRASSPIAMSHTNASSVLYNGKIWSFGGEPHYGQTFSTVYVYDPSSNTWSTNTSLPQGRFAANAVNINGVFYFANGSESSKSAWKGILS